MQKNSFENSNNYIDGFFYKGNWHTWSTHIGWTEEYSDWTNTVVQYSIDALALARGGKIYIDDSSPILPVLYINDRRIYGKDLGYFSPGTKIKVAIDEPENYKRIQEFFNQDKCPKYGIDNLASWVLRPNKSWIVLRLEPDGTSIYDENAEDTFIIPEDGMLQSSIITGNNLVFNLKQNNINNNYQINGLGSQQTYQYLIKVKKGDVINPSVTYNGKTVYPNKYQRLRESKNLDNTYWNIAHFIQGLDCSLDAQASFMFIPETPSVSPYLLAGFSKTKMKSGDTVDIVIKKLLPNGEKINFPEGSQYEVGITTGCEFGEILKSNGEKGIYFEGIEEPIRYIVKNDFLVSEAKVKIKLGVKSYDIYPAHPEEIADIQNEVFDCSVNDGNDEIKKYQMGNIQLQKKQEMNNTYCSVSDFLSYRRTNFSGVIENEDCDFDNNLCDGSTKSSTPKITIENVGSTYEGVDVCKLSGGGNSGGFFPLISPQAESNNHTFVDYNVAVCLNTKSNPQKWYTYIENNELKIRVLNGICPDVYNKPSDIKFIKSVDDFISRITTEELAEQAMIRLFEWTLYHKLEYTSELNNMTRFMFEEMIKHHEDQHMSDFVNDKIPKALTRKHIASNSYQFNNYAAMVEDFSLNRNQYNCSKAVTEAKKYFKQANKELIRNLSDIHRDEWGDSKTVNTRAYNRENAINDDNAMRKIIIKYQEILLLKYPNIANKKITKNPVYGGKQRGLDFKIELKEGNK